MRFLVKGPQAENIIRIKAVIVVPRLWTADCTCNRMLYYVKIVGVMRNKFAALEVVHTLLLRTILTHLAKLWGGSGNYGIYERQRIHLPSYVSNRLEKAGDGTGQ